MLINSEQTIETLRKVLWKTKRSIEDRGYDEEIDQYVMNEEYRERILSRINKVLGVKPKSRRNYD